MRECMSTGISERKHEWTTALVHERGNEWTLAWAGNNWDSQNKWSYVACLLVLRCFLVRSLPKRWCVTSPLVQAQIHEECFFGNPTRFVFLDKGSTAWSFFLSIWVSLLYSQNTFLSRQGHLRKLRTNRCVLGRNVRDAYISFGKSSSQFIADI